MLRLIGMPSAKTLNELVAKITSKVEIRIANNRNTNVMRVLENLSRINKNIIIIEDENIYLNDLPRSAPLTRIYGLYDGRVIIAGDLEDILIHGFKEYIALAGKAVDIVVPLRIRQIINSYSRPRIVRLFVVPGIPCLKAMHLLGHLAIVDNNLNIIIIDVHKLNDYYKKYSKGALPLIIVDDSKSKIGAPKDIDELVELVYHEDQG